MIWESGAILFYLLKHYNPEYKLWSKDDEKQSNITEWAFYQVSGFGPYIGQAFWYVHYFVKLIERFSFDRKEKIPPRANVISRKSNASLVCWIDISISLRTKDDLQRDSIRSQI